MNHTSISIPKTVRAAYDGVRDEVGQPNADFILTLLKGFSMLPAETRQAAIKFRNDVLPSASRSVVAKP